MRNHTLVLLATLSACSAVPDDGSWSFRATAWEPNECNGDLLGIAPLEGAAASLTREQDELTLDSYLGPIGCTHEEGAYTCLPNVFFSVSGDDTGGDVDFLFTATATYTLTFPKPRHVEAEVAVEMLCEGADCAALHDLDEDGAMASCSATGVQEGSHELAF